MRLEFLPDAVILICVSILYDISLLFCGGVCGCGFSTSANASSSLVHAARTSQLSTNTKRSASAVCVCVVGIVALSLSRFSPSNVQCLENSKMRYVLYKFHFI